MIISRILSLTLLALVASSPRTRADYVSPPPTHPVGTASFEWRDEKRDRVVPVKIYFPKDATTPLPVIIFSHGLGGSREGYAYLGRHWAGCGYVSVHLQHAGSDSAVWKDVPAAERGSALQKAGMGLASSMNRPRDVSFAIDELERLQASDTFVLHGRLDLKRIGVSGHSFGGWTTLASAGQTFITPLKKANFGDPRIIAGIQMSAPANRVRTNLDESYGTITIPLMHLSGTKDVVPLFPDTTAEDRRIPFDHMAHSETCFVNFKNGDHMIFSGAPRPNETERAQDAIFQKLICAGTTAFWDAYLRANSEAKSWLLGDGYAKQLGDNATFEHKIPARK